MKKIYTLVLTFILLSTVKSFSQDLHRAEVAVSTIGNIHYARAKTLRPISSIGLNYQRYVFDQTYVVFGLQGMSMTYNDDSSDSLNLYKGELQYRQWMASAGVRHYFKEEIVNTINFFGEVSFHYNRVGTFQNYEDGEFGTAFHAYSKYRGVGFGFKAGSVYQSYDNWYIGANAAAYLSGGSKGEIAKYEKPTTIIPEIEQFNINEILARFAFEIRLGFRF